jgi:hypothetical protein
MPVLLKEKEKETKKEKKKKRILFWFTSHEK